jgi:cytoskeletal protein CcmA (bactofilin family)
MPGQFTGGILIMSETMTRDLSGAVQSVRRTASHSVTLLKAATGFNGRTPSTFEPANEIGPEPTPLRPPPTIISANTELTGSLVTADELHVHGKIKGDLRAAAITVCAGAIVKGDLAADTIVVDGTVEGRIEGQHVLLRGGASVNGEIVHGSLGIDTAAVFEGTIKRVASAPIAAE